eukprot:13173898-Alexandrium_andersonii.AAC.1
MQKRRGVAPKHAQRPRTRVVLTVLRKNIDTNSVDAGTSSSPSKLAQQSGRNKHLPRCALRRLLHIYAYGSLGGRVVVGLLLRSFAATPGCVFGARQCRLGERPKRTHCSRSERHPPFVRCRRGPRCITSAPFRDTRVVVGRRRPVGVRLSVRAKGLVGSLLLGGRSQLHPRIDFRNVEWGVVHLCAWNSRRVPPTHPTHPRDTSTARI